MGHLSIFLSTPLNMWHPLTGESRGEAARLDAEVAVARCASTCAAAHLAITEQAGMSTKISAGVAAALCRSQKVGASPTFNYSGCKSVSSLNQSVRPKRCDPSRKV